MDLEASLSVVRRRWPVVVAGLVILVVAMGQVAGVRPQFQAALTVALIAPPKPGDLAVAHLASGQQNAYLGGESDLTVFAKVTAAAVSDAGIASRLAAKGATAPYTLAPMTSGPLGAGGHALVVSAQDGDTATAIRTAEAVAGAIRDDTATRQAALGIPLNDWVRTQEIGRPVITRFNKTRVRLLAGIAAGGLAGIFMAVFGLEALSRRRALATAARLAGRIPVSSVLRRRWYLVAVGFPAVAAIVVGGVKATPASFRATSTLVLLPPQLPVNPNIPAAKRGTQNPFLSYSDSLDILAQVTTNLVSQRGAVDAIRSTKGLGGSYQVINWVQGPDPVSTLGDPIPVIRVSATAGTAEAATRTVDAVNHAVGADLADLQSTGGAPPVTQVTAQQVTPPQAYQLHGSKVRALAALGGLAVAGLWFLVWIIDRVLSGMAPSQSRRRTEATLPPSAEMAHA